MLQAVTRTMLPVLKLKIFLFCSFQSGCIRLRENRSAVFRKMRHNKKRVPKTVVVPKTFLMGGERWIKYRAAVDRNHEDLQVFYYCEGALRLRSVQLPLFLQLETDYSPEVCKRASKTGGMQSGFYFRMSIGERSRRRTDRQMMLWGM